MKNVWNKTILLGSALTALAGCAQGDGPAAQTVTPPEVSWNPSIDGAVVKAQFSLDLQSGSDSVGTNAANLPVTVVYDPSAAMTVSVEDFAVPLIGSDILDFGNLKITDLRDNNLKVCGSDNKTRCTNAFIRVYTTGTAGAGLYNAVDGYGMPITANLPSMAALGVGLGATNAAVMQTLNISSGRNNLRLSDFSTTPIYKILSDFSNAGAGTYSTTIVVEYGLSM